jgi:3-hydroxyisobutyrate dehydrogenase-like beta-hydroxyacid dehydrogenase
MKFGSIGLGVVGAPMAWHLSAAGHGIATTLNRSPLPDGLEAKVLVSPAEVARESEIVITMLPDTPDVEQVLLGRNGVAEGISPGAMVIDMSSISPIATARFAETIRKAGAGYLDAPVSGGEVGAKAASLSQAGDIAAFAPGFRIRLHQKDLGLALESARVLGVSLPNTATAQELMNACARRRGGCRPFLTGTGAGNLEQPRTLERKGKNRCAEPARRMSS